MKCPICGARVVKAGIAYGAEGRPQQRYKCKRRSCGKSTINPKR